MGIYLENFKIAIAALKVNSIRSFLTVLGVVIGVFSVIMIIAIVTGLKDEIRSQIISLGGDVIDVIPASIEEFGPGSEQIFAIFEENDVKTLKEQRHLFKYITEVYEFTGNYEYKDKRKSGFIMGVNPSYPKIREKGVETGRFFRENEQRQADKVVVIGTNVATKFFGNYEKASDRNIKINGKEFKVIGVFEKENLRIGSFDINNSVYIPSTTAKQVFEEARLTDIFIKAHSENEVKNTVKVIEKILNEERGKEKFSVLSQEDMLKVVDQITRLITTALAGLASISLLVGGIGIMNIMLVSVTERTREIGIRKAVGADNKHILIQFLTEAIVLSLLGGFIGLLLASLISFVLNKYTGISSLINLETVLGAAGFSVIVGVIFGTAPAYKASQKDPIEALRYE